MDPKYGATKGNGATETSTALSDNSIRSSSENSNPQNGGRASVEVGGEGQTLDELRREYRERTEAYTRANEANDQDYDYEGELRRINELEQLMTPSPTTPTWSGRRSCAPIQI